MGTLPNNCLLERSGYSDDPTITDFKKFGFSGAVTKPYRMDDLGRVIFEAIKGKKE